MDVEVMAVCTICNQDSITEQTYPHVVRSLHMEYLLQEYKSFYDAWKVVEGMNINKGGDSESFPKPCSLCLVKVINLVKATYIMTQTWKSGYELRGSTVQDLDKGGSPIKSEREKVNIEVHSTSQERVRSPINSSHSGRQSKKRFGKSSSETSSSVKETIPDWKSSEFRTRHIHLLDKAINSSGSDTKRRNPDPEELEQKVFQVAQNEEQYVSKLSGLMAYFNKALHSSAVSNQSSLVTVYNPSEGEPSSEVKKIEAKMTSHLNTEDITESDLGFVRLADHKMEKITKIVEEVATASLKLEPELKKCAGTISVNRESLQVKGFGSSECESGIKNEVCVLSQKEKPAKQKSYFKRHRKVSLNLKNLDFDEQINDEDTSFRFPSKVVELNKISQITKPCELTSFITALKSKSVKPKHGHNEKASSIFDTYDDPYVMEILEREKAEAKNVAGNAQKGSTFVKGAQQIMQFSPTLGCRKRNRFPNYCDDKEFESPAKQQGTFDKEDLNWKCAIDVSKSIAPSTTLPPQIESLQDSADSIPMSPSLMVSPVLPQKFVYLEGDDVENDSNEFVPDLDELLKLPERPTDGSKTKDELLDEFDREIAERQQLDEEEMARVEADIEAINQKRIQRKLRLKENAKLRNRLETELTETRLLSMFNDNLQYLRDIWSGKVESSRHQAYHESIRSRHALYYTIITDPFTDDQLDWTLDEISKVWMSTRRDELDNKEYVWKVLLAECFIKFYMDFFNVSKSEAMTRISETPLHKKDRLREFMSKSDEEESEED